MNCLFYTLYDSNITISEYDVLMIMMIYEEISSYSIETSFLIILIV